MNRTFKFKQFSVSQDRCAMKIGTDGVLLGAWASLENNPESILDIGAGTGVIALMLAQRSASETIDALEIDENAYEQCVENFEASPWGDRLFCYHASLEEFTEEIDVGYELIVSNPPFYDAEFLSPQTSRNKARFAVALPFSELLHEVSKLLFETGIFCVIVPYKNQEEFIRLANANNLRLQRLTTVQGNPTSTIKRSLLQFGFKEKELVSDRLIIEKSRHDYTEDYIALTKDFYLKM
ncbi:MAG TPA: methyltransferase [Flavobacteriaceae bacterium]|nr:methyltransferase [Flavobacteriaceae bacterium]